MPVFNNDGGPCALQRHASRGGWVSVQLFFVVVDGQILIRGVSSFSLNMKYIKCSSTCSSAGVLFCFSSHLVQL